MAEYMGRILMTYPQYSQEYIENDMPMAFGWYLVNYAIENNGWYQFCGLRAKGGTYMETEVSKLVKQYYDAKEKEIKRNGG